MQTLSNTNTDIQPKNDAHGNAFPIIINIDVRVEQSHFGTNFAMLSAKVATSGANFANLILLSNRRVIVQYLERHPYPGAITIYECPRL